MRAQVSGVHDARRHTSDRHAEVSRWRSTVGCLVTLALFLAPLVAEAQPPPKVPRIGVLSAFSSTAVSRHRDAFR
jgi:hypothetical protein